MLSARCLAWVWEQASVHWSFTPLFICIMSDRLQLSRLVCLLRCYCLFFFPEMWIILMQFCIFLWTVSSKSLLALLQYVQVLLFISFPPMYSAGLSFWNQFCGHKISWQATRTSVFWHRQQVPWGGSELLTYSDHHLLLKKVILPERGDGFYLQLWCRCFDYKCYL